MHAPTTRDLFDEPAATSPLSYREAFDAWAETRGAVGVLRELSSVAVYRSIWGALAAWCVARGLALETLRPQDFEAYLHSRGKASELTPRHAWRLLTLADAVLAHRARTLGTTPNTAARELLHATPPWRYANAAEKTPLPAHLGGSQARQLVAWLLDPARERDAGPPWQGLRNRTAVALQLGAGLAPADLRAALLDGVVIDGGRTPGLPWKLCLPAHGAIAARETPMAPWAARLLRRWLEVRAGLGIAGPWLFPSTRSGRPWGKVAQYQAARAVLEAAGLADLAGGSFRLRHSFALRQLRRGTAPEQVAGWLGLADSTAMRQYRRVLDTAPDVI